LPDVFVDEREETVEEESKFPRMTAAPNLADQKQEVDAATRNDRNFPYIMKHSNQRFEAALKIHDHWAYLYNTFSGVKFKTALKMHKQLQTQFVIGSRGQEWYNELTDGVFFLGLIDQNTDETGSTLFWKMLETFKDDWVKADKGGMNLSLLVRLDKADWRVFFAMFRRELETAYGTPTMRILKNYVEENCMEHPKGATAKLLFETDPTYYTNMEEILNYEITNEMPQFMLARWTALQEKVIAAKLVILADGTTLFQMKMDQGTFGNSASNARVFVAMELVAQIYFLMTPLMDTYEREIRANGGAIVPRTRARSTRSFQKFPDPSSSGTAWFRQPRLPVWQR